MKRRNFYRFIILSVIMAIMVLFAFGCSGGDDSGNGKNSSKISPVIITEAVRGDADDPAIWINKNNPAESLILGTDKITNGALYVFDLAGHIIREKTVYGLERPNNVDVEYGLLISGTPVDIAVVTERGAHRLRVYRLPDMTPIDNGGIPVFTGEEDREPMGIALYKRPRDGAVFSIVSRKEGARNGRYLWQYLLEDDGHGGVTGTKVREFGLFSGKKEIEAVAVDDELGYVYYSDERAGIRKYHADPSAANADVELTIIDTSGYGGDNEGISLYKINDGTGYLIVSDQGANRFYIYPREGVPGNPHQHEVVKSVHLSTSESDGSDMTNTAVSASFPAGLFVAMSNEGTFHYYSWTDIAGSDLVIAPNGIKP
ncbi:MAG: phytase [Smithella sp.]|nr:phytase [Smithella sp.]